MTAPGELPRVLIVDTDLTKDDALDRWVDVARVAGWQPVNFDEAIPAIEEIEHDPKVLKAAMIAHRIGRGGFSELTAPKLVQAVQDHDIPCAVITNGMSLDNTPQTFKNSNMIVDEKGLNITWMLEGWLRHLRDNQ
ncbi:MAG: hypothetical protein V4702_02985 [Patescibacteria group bacterium]